MEQPYIHENDIPRLACELHDLKGRAIRAKVFFHEGSDPIHSRGPRAEGSEPWLGAKQRLSDLGGSNRPRGRNARRKSLDESMRSGDGHGSATAGLHRVEIGEDHDARKLGDGCVGNKIEVPMLVRNVPRA